MAGDAKLIRFRRVVDRRDGAVRPPASMSHTDQSPEGSI
jgi:hypothetical protein